jgi:hypothetical protein
MTATMNSSIQPRAGSLSALTARGFQLLVLLACWLAAAMSGKAMTLTENFATDPLASGWQIYGDTNLFYWNSTNQNLDVTWDSSQTNSYFYRPLGTILAKSDAFSVAFDLQLSDIADNSPQIVVGLFNFANATNGNFSRPAVTTPNLFEFDYYADNGNGQPSIVATLTDTNVGPANKKDFYFVYDNQPLNTGINYHVVLTHTAGTTNLTGQVLVNGQIYSSLPNVFAGPITDFRIDTVSITSYGGGSGATPAHGTVGNLVVTLPPPPVQNLTVGFTNNYWTVQFFSQSNWLYTLQLTTNFSSWNSVSSAASGNGTNLFLPDTNAPATAVFYRVKASRP